MKRIAVVLIFLLAGFPLAQDAASDSMTVADVLAANEDVTIFAELLEDTEMMLELAQPGLFTVFAPTDAAFEELGEEFLAELASDRGVIEYVLRNHIALGGSDIAALANMGYLTNVEGHTYLMFLAADGTLRVDEAEVVNGNLLAINGVVHTIDTVLLPEPYWSDRGRTAAPEVGGAD